MFNLIKATRIGKLEIFEVPLNDSQFDGFNFISEFEPFLVRIYLFLFQQIYLEDFKKKK